MYSMKSQNAITNRVGCGTQTVHLCNSEAFDENYINRAVKARDKEWRMATESGNWIEKHTWTHSFGAFNHSIWIENMNQSRFVQKLFVRIVGLVVSIREMVTAQNWFGSSWDAAPHFKCRHRFTYKAKEPLSTRAELIRCWIQLWAVSYR